MTRGALRRRRGRGRASRLGPRPATQPAQSSGGTTVPGMNHVQSTSECTPKTTTTIAERQQPESLGVVTARARARARARSSGSSPASQAASSASVSARPASPRFGRGLHEVPVGVQDVEVVLAEAQARELVAARADADARAAP